MSISHTNCQNGKTLSGGSVSGWAIFDGTGYCKTHAQTVGNVDFRLYGRVTGYTSTTVDFRMFLFARKTSTTSDSWNNSINSVVTFTFGDASATAKTADPRVPGSGKAVRCLGWTDVTGMSIKTSSAGSRPFKAVFDGISGTQDCNRSYTVSTTLNFNENGTIALSNQSTSGVTGTVSSITTGRNFPNMWDWSIKKGSGSYSVKKETTVASDSETTSSAYTFSSLDPGETYTLRWRFLMRNYNTTTGASTKSAPIYTTTKSVTLAKVAGKCTLDKSSLTVQYGSTGTLNITSNHGGTISISPASPTSYYKYSRSGTAITITPTAVGSQKLTVTCAATTSNNAKSAECTITITPNPSAVPHTSIVSAQYTGSTITGYSKVGTNCSITGGTYQASAVGSYSFTVKPNANYAWTDGTTTQKTITWSITAPPSRDTNLSPTTTSVNLKEVQTYSFSATPSTGGGSLVATSADTSIASVATSGNTATITANKIGSTTISCYIAADGTYPNSGTKNISVTVRPAEVKVGATTAPVYIGDKPVRRIYIGSKLLMF